MPFDLISIGDPTIDTLVVIHDAEVRCELKRQENCVICIEFGDKIPVDNIEQKTAGNGMNVAVGSSRLGLQVAFHGIVGEDTPGDQIIKALKADKVNTRLVVRDKKHNTNASTVINFKGERTILVYHAPRVYKMAKLPKTRWIYYTSVGKNHGKLNSAIVDYIKNSNTKLAYNPGTFQMLAGSVAVKKVASHCEVMFVNKQEAERIFGDGGNITHLLHKMHEVGVVIPVITDGVNGSYASDGNQVWHMPMYPFTAIERTGAGDSYATGFVASLASGNDVQTAMQWGTANGASVVLNIGPQDGLLKKKDLLAFINKPKCRTIKPRTVKPSRSR
jgi:ribokinase